ncbi:MAG: hypothetical protein K2J94_03580, partial [Duncaniella sp.]|nr:hypothetical protein [Duncaniella sp.]
MKSAAENYYFENIGIADGLSHSTVNAIIQDRKGFMWFGTKCGLCRYDGLSIREFHRQRGMPYTLGNNLIKCLYEDADRNIWVGTDEGLYVYSLERETFTSITDIVECATPIVHTVTAIDADRKGMIWFAV